ncbi:Glutathione S-transferase [Holothuria leucospilota]|uniref:glutathione transferase n=1 Tax=Holothuria leucospilota TaxID=206669 RepID=A0A9Q0YH59_HOLLE|nr:Glutathione S-transferase [Holothuria leucospilota]
MPSYKLIYFNAKGRAEPSRYLFELAGTGYENKRLEPDEWKKLKPELPHGQLPVLEVDGKRMIQSYAIHHYLADELGFSPKTTWDKAMVEMILETGREMNPTIGRIFTTDDESIKAEFKAKLENEAAPKVIALLEKALKANNDGKDWFVGDKVTLADVIIFNTFYDFLPAVFERNQGEYTPSGFPLFTSFMERFRALPQIKKWIENRPATKNVPWYGKEYKTKWFQKSCLFL